LVRRFLMALGSSTCRPTHNLYQLICGGSPSIRKEKVGPASPSPLPPHSLPFWWGCLPPANGSGGDAGGDELATRRLTMREAAGLLGVSKEAIRKRVVRGTLPSEVGRTDVGTCTSRRGVTWLPPRCQPMSMMSRRTHRRAYSQPKSKYARASALERFESSALEKKRVVNEPMPRK
jgi:hypothetical protein